MIDSKLKTVLSVAETLNLTKSARNLSLTQPAVSQHIKSIEEALGVKLFTRTNKGLKITPQGDIVVNYAKKMNGLYSLMIQQLKDEQRSVRHITVGVTPTAESNMISQVLALYGIHNPSVRITIISDTINNLYTNIDSLHNNEIGLVYGYLKQAIDLNFLVNLSQDTIMLKICKFCHKAFIPKNSKAEYDTPQCKNKANVYSFRKRAQEEDN